MPNFGQIGPFLKSPGFTYVTDTQTLLDSSSTEVRKRRKRMNHRKVNDSLFKLNVKSFPGITVKLNSAQISRTYFCSDSPSDKEVAILDPGCVTKKFFPDSDATGVIKHSCSCPQTTRSKNSSKKLSGMWFFGPCFALKDKE